MAARQWWDARAVARYRIAVGKRDPRGEVETELRGRLYRFHAEATGIDDGELLVVTARDDGGHLVAGLFGWTWGGTCFVDLLHVAEAHRGAGLGSRLLRAAEAEGVRRGCSQSVLATHSFQAPDFYRSRGYVEYGRIDGYPAGHAQIHLAKPLP
jgi:GNAT superfamily N-acetyltransferase